MSADIPRGLDRPPLRALQRPLLVQLASGPPPRKQSIDQLSGRTARNGVPDMRGVGSSTAGGDTNEAARNEFVRLRARFGQDSVDTGQAWPSGGQPFSGDDKSGPYFDEFGIISNE